MNFNFDLNLVQSQKLLLTPQLKQALEILKMNSQELFEYVEEQLEANPALEPGEADEMEENDEFCFSMDDFEWDKDNFYREELRHEKLNDFSIVDDFAVDKSTIKLSLKEHLLFQLHTSELDKKQIIIGEHIIDNIDENGYLTARLRDIAEYFNIRAGKVSKILDKIQTFDPPGIGARSLKECLMLQLNQMNRLDEDAKIILQNHLDDLAANKITAIARKTGIDLQKVKDVFNLIKTLEPKPGREFYNNDNIKFIIPDILVKKIHNHFESIINDDAVPIVNINKYYRKIISEELSSDTRKFIQNNIDSAIWLIKCIEQRKNTIRKIAECIIQNQEEFFEKGNRYIKPLTMKTIANEIGMHESTVSRTVNGKYIQCRWGVFEMRYFFTGKLSTGDGTGISTESVKAMVSDMIKNENRKAPLSDNDIAENIKREGVDISRRTVAKYRAEMQIPPISKRKEYE